MKERIETFKKYFPLLKQLVTKDLKLKYRRSFLGYLWSVLNPLLTMLIMVLVFSHMFRSDIEHFAVYVLVGQTVFGFFSEGTNQGIGAVVGNAALLKKTYVPKYIFPIAKVTSCFVNMLFSLGALLIVCIFSQIRPNWYMLLIPFVLVEVYFFTLGVGLFLAQANVFFRDTQYIWAVVLTAWMYFSALFYPITMLPKMLQRVIKFANPVYSYIAQFRGMLIDGALPEPKYFLYGIGWAALAMVIGLGTFQKAQDKFILYI